MIKVIVKSRGVLHLALDTEHIRVDNYTIEAGLPILYNKFQGSHKTPKKKGAYGEFGKTKSLYYFKTTPKGEEFTSIPELLKSINCELAE